MNHNHIYNKNLNYCKVSLNYLKNYNSELLHKIDKLEKQQIQLQEELNTNSNHLKELIGKRESLIHEIKKGKELQELIRKNDSILNKINNV